MTWQPVHAPWRHPDGGRFKECVVDGELWPCTAERDARELEESRWRLARVRRLVDEHPPDAVPQVDLAELRAALDLDAPDRTEEGTTR